MSDAIPQDLQELSRELAAARQSPWQPRTVSRAFARRKGLRFTMQTWIDLEAMRSPLLAGGVPEAEELDATFEAWGLTFGDLSPEQALEIVTDMRALVAEGFRAALKVKPPQDMQTPSGDIGCGDWAVLLSFLVETGHTVAEALTVDVAQVFILLATTRLRAGWQIDDAASYALRDVAEGQMNG